MKRIWALFCIASAAWLLPVHRRGLAMLAHNIAANALITMGVLWLPSRWSTAKAITAGVVSVLRMGWSLWQGALQAMPPAPFQPLFADRTAYLLLVWGCLLTQTVNRTLLPAWFVNLQVTCHAIVFSTMGYKFDSRAAAPQQLSFLHQAALFLGPQLLVHVPILLLSRLWAWYDPTWNKPTWQRAAVQRSSPGEPTASDVPTAVSHAPAGPEGEAAGKLSYVSTDAQASILKASTAMPADTQAISPPAACSTSPLLTTAHALRLHSLACLRSLVSMFTKTWSGANAQTPQARPCAAPATGAGLLARMSQHRYSQYACKTHKVCLKLETHLECSDLPSNLIEQLQGALSSVVGPALVITGCAARNGCIMITLDLRECGTFPGSRSRGGTGGGSYSGGSDGGDGGDGADAAAGGPASMSQRVAAALLPTLQKILNEAAAAKEQQTQLYAANGSIGGAPAAAAAASVPPAAPAAPAPAAAAAVHAAHAGVAATAAAAECTAGISQIMSEPTTEPLDDSDVHPELCREAVVQVDQDVCEATFGNSSNGWQLVPRRQGSGHSLCSSTSNSSDGETSVSQPWLGVATIAGVTVTTGDSPRPSPGAATASTAAATGDSGSGSRSLQKTSSAGTIPDEGMQSQAGVKRQQGHAVTDSGTRCAAISLLLDVAVQVWGFGKLDELQGWSADEVTEAHMPDHSQSSAPQLQKQRCENEQEQGHKAHGTIINGVKLLSTSHCAPAYKLLARCSGSYLHTRVQHCRRDVASTSTMVQAVLEVPDACLARHHPGTAPSCMMLLVLELWQDEVLISTSPLLAIPPRATIHVSTTPALPATTGAHLGNPISAAAGGVHRGQPMSAAAAHKDAPMSAAAGGVDLDESRPAAAAGAHRAAPTLADDTSSTGPPPAPMAPQGGAGASVSKDDLTPKGTSRHHGHVAGAAQSSTSHHQHAPTGKTQRYSIGTTTGPASQVTASSTQFGVSHVLPTAWWWGSGGHTLTGAITELDACSRMLCAEAAAVPEAGLHSHLQFLRDLAVWLLEVRRMAAGFCDACAAGPPLPATDKAAAATTSSLHQLRLDPNSQLQLADDLMQYARQVGLHGVHAQIAEQLQSVIIPSGHQRGGLVPALFQPLWRHICPSMSPSILLYLQSARYAILGHRCAHCELRYKEQLLAQLSRVQVFCSAGLAMYGLMATKRAAQLGGYWHLFLCIPWFLLHACAVVARYRLPTAPPELAIRLSAYGYLWRVACRLSFQLGLLPLPPLSAYFCRTLKGWPATHLILSLTEQMQASAILPAKAIFAVALGADFGCMAMCLWQHSQHRLQALLILPLVTILPRLVLDTTLRYKAVRVWRRLHG